jgi:SlyX protein
MANPVEERLAELESRLAFQEDIIDNLNQVVTRQDRELLALKQQLIDLAARVREFHDAAAESGPAFGVEIPPHY